MNLARSVMFGAAALALATGSAYAEKKPKDDDPGFNALDKNKDGYLSRSEAAANPELAKKFDEADKNHDGKLSRAEYLAVMAKKDLNTAKEKVTDLTRNKKSDSSASSSGAASRSTGKTSPQ